ncbi:unnamed protein product, partial [Didymodactylos carnosus]
NETNIMANCIGSDFDALHTCDACDTEAKVQCRVCEYLFCAAHLVDHHHQRNYRRLQENGQRIINMINIMHTIYLNLQQQVNTVKTLINESLLRNAEKVYYVNVCGTLIEKEQLEVNRCKNSFNGERRKIRSHTVSKFIQQRPITLADITKTRKKVISCCQQFFRFAQSCTNSLCYLKRLEKEFETVAPGWIVPKHPNPRVSVVTHTYFPELEELQQVRVRTFSHWSHSMPSKQHVIQAGFFACNYADRTLCIYCNVVCHKWTAYDYPDEIHELLSPNCFYIKSNLHKKPLMTNSLVLNETPSDRLIISGEDMLSRLIAARLDLPMVRNLVKEKLQLSLMERCYEEQLRFKNDDFASASDLRMAYRILDIQMKCVNGNEANIIIPGLVPGLSGNDVMVPEILFSSAIPAFL